MPRSVTESAEDYNKRREAIWQTVCDDFERLARICTVFSRVLFVGPGDSHAWAVHSDFDERASCLIRILKKWGHLHINPKQLLRVLPKEKDGKSLLRDQQRPLGIFTRQTMCQLVVSSVAYVRMNYLLSTILGADLRRAAIDIPGSEPRLPGQTRPEFRNAPDRVNIRPDEQYAKDKTAVDDWTPKYVKGERKSKSKSSPHGFVPGAVTLLTVNPPPDDTGEWQIFPNPTQTAPEKLSHSRKFYELPISCIFRMGTQTYKGEYAGHGAWKVCYILHSDVEDDQFNGCVLKTTTASYDQEFDLCKNLAHMGIYPVQHRKNRQCQIYDASGKRLQDKFVWISERVQPLDYYLQAHVEDKERLEFVFSRRNPAHLRDASAQDVPRRPISAQPRHAPGQNRNSRRR